MEISQPEVAVEGLLDAGGQVGIVQSGGQTQLSGKLVHEAGGFVEHGGGGLGNGNTAGVAVAQRRTPVAQTAGNDQLVLVEGLVLLRVGNFMGHPLLHLIPMGLDDGVVAVVAVHPVGHDHVGTAPQGRGLAAPALTGGDHLPDTVDLVLGAEIVDVLLVGCLHVVVHDTRVADHLGIPQPAALLASGAILGEAVVVGAEGGHHDALEVIQLGVSTLEGAGLGQVGGHDVANADGQLGVHAVLAEIVVARDLHVAEGVVGEAGSPDLPLSVAAGDVDVLLDALGGEGACRAEVQIARLGDVLGEAEGDLGAAGGVGDMDLHDTRHVLAEVHDPRAVLLTAGLLDRQGGEGTDDTDGGHHAELQLALGDGVLYNGAPLLLVAVVIGEVGGLQTAVVGLAAVEVVQHDGAVLVLPVGRVGGDDLLFAILVLDLQLGQQADVAELHAAAAPGAGLRVPAVTQQGGQSILFGDQGGDVVDAVEDFLFVVGEGRVDHVLADLLPVDVILTAPQTAGVELGGLDPAPHLELGPQVGCPALDVAFGLDERADPLVGVDGGAELHRGGGGLTKVVGDGDGQGIVGTGLQRRLHGDVDGLGGSLPRPCGGVTAHLGDSGGVGGLEDVRVVGVQLPAYVEILTGGVRGILDGVDGEVIEL